ncbi:MAG: phytanoyl-CoA dioxygenase family protein [Pseudomonadota bacterium]
MHANIRKSIDACAAHYGEQSEAMKNYLIDGERQALQMSNRGPIRFTSDDQLCEDILEAYSEYGFYVFEGVLGNDELKDITEDLEDLQARFPLEPGGALSKDGKPALGADCKALNLLWSKPLGDPLGGTDLANGRHQVKLIEPEADETAPEQSPFVLLGSLQFSEACLRVYGHPQLLRVAEAVNGHDFAPFNEALFIKEPGIGAAVSWHQDGDTHWNSEHFDEGIHGFNFMAQAYGSTAVNGVWVLPGSHKLGRINIKTLVEEAGSERIEGAVPIICNAGDVVICNRQIVHGSFPNSGFERRVTVNFGFHRRSSVLGVMGAGIHSEAEVYDADLIEQRSRVIGYAIEARKQRFPKEESFQYQPFVESGKSFAWNEHAKQDLKDYNLQDLSI